MQKLDKQAENILQLLVQHLPNVVAHEPRTFLGYKVLHDKLGLPMRGSTFGESLSRQGLGSLAEWTAEHNYPAITGIVIDSGELMPGKGYFRLFNKSLNDFQWWANQVEASKQFDWSPYLPASALPKTPTASDLSKPERVAVSTHRILRDTAIARQVKALHGFKCQICDHTILLPDGSLYAEAHHIQPLGAPHDGPDVSENILCVCPNHHAELDYGAHKLSLADIRQANGHSIGQKFTSYHNDIICI